MELPVGIRPVDIIGKGIDGNSIPRLYIKNGWGLRIQVHNSNTTLAQGATLGLRFLILGYDGQLYRTQKYIKPTSTRANFDYYEPLTEGYLISLEIGSDTAGIKKGECYVEASLLSVIDTAQHIVKLTAGYVYSQHNVTYPGNWNGHTVADDDAFLRLVAGTNPAAGAEVNNSVASDARWRLYAVRFQLVTDATVATRRVHLIIDDGATTILDIPSETTQTASLTRNYTFHDFGLTPSAVGTEISVNMTSKKLKEGWRIRTSTDNLQAGDDYGIPQMYVEEWLEE